MNKVILIGNITKDLELKKTPSNKSVVEFSVALNEGYGEKKTTEYINVVAWEKTAETLANYCGRGSKIMVEGKIKTDTYEKNGAKVYKTYVLANNIEFLNSRDTHSESVDTRKSVQPTLTRDDGRDMFGRKQEVVIDPEELPFY
jgi:single-strand DNA-binding protein